MSPPSTNSHSHSPFTTPPHSSSILPYDSPGLTIGYNSSTSISSYASPLLNKKEDFNTYKKGHGEGSDNDNSSMNTNVSVDKYKGGNTKTIKQSGSFVFKLHANGGSGVDDDDTDNIDNGEDGEDDDDNSLAYSSDDQSSSNNKDHIMQAREHVSPQYIPPAQNQNSNRGESDSENENESPQSVSSSSSSESSDTESESNVKKYSTYGLPPSLGGNPPSKSSKTRINNYITGHHGGDGGGGGSFSPQSVELTSLYDYTSPIHPDVGGEDCNNYEELYNAEMSGSFQFQGNDDGNDDGNDVKSPKFAVFDKNFRRSKMSSSSKQRKAIQAMKERSNLLLSKRLRELKEMQVYRPNSKGVLDYLVFDAISARTPTRSSAAATVQPAITTTNTQFSKNKQSIITNNYQENEEQAILRTLKSLVLNFESANSTAIARTLVGIHDDLDVLDKFKTEKDRKREEGVRRVREEERAERERVKRVESERARRVEEERVERVRVEEVERLNEESRINAENEKSQFYAYNLDVQTSSDRLINEIAGLRVQRIEKFTASTNADVKKRKLQMRVVLNRVFIKLQQTNESENGRAKNVLEVSEELKRCYLYLNTEDAQCTGDNVHGGVYFINDVITRTSKIISNLQVTSNKSGTGKSLTVLRDKEYYIIQSLSAVLGNLSSDRDINSQFEQSCAMTIDDFFSGEIGALCPLTIPCNVSNNVEMTRIGIGMKAVESSGEGGRDKIDANKATFKLTGAQNYNGSQEVSEVKAGSGNAGADVGADADSDIDSYEQPSKYIDRTILLVTYYACYHSSNNSEHGVNIQIGYLDEVFRSFGIKFNPNANDNEIHIPQHLPFAIAPLLTAYLTPTIKSLLRSEVFKQRYIPVFYRVLDVVIESMGMEDVFGFEGNQRWVFLLKILLDDHV